MMDLSGKKIMLIGVPRYEGKIFSVTEVEHGLAECEGEDGTLLLPINDALSFGVMVLKDKDALPQPEKDSAALSESSTPAYVPEAAPAAHPVHAFTYEEGQLYTGHVIYWQGHWGKIEHPELHNGIFFHMSMIEDDELLTILSAPDHDEPLVTYTITKNPRRISGFCAANVRLAREDLWEEPVPEELQELDSPQTDEQ